MHTCTLAYMHTCTLAYMHTCTHAHMHTCTHVHTHTCTHTVMSGCDGAATQYYEAAQSKHKHKQTHKHTHKHNHDHKHSARTRPRQKCLRQDWGVASGKTYTLTLAIAIHTRRDASRTHHGLALFLAHTQCSALRGTAPLFRPKTTIRKQQASNMEGGS